MTERALKVPYALDAQGKVVSPLAAQKGAVYTCLECAQRLDLRRSRLERPHFTHRSDARRDCLGESATHLAAKHLLRAQLEGELETNESITWQLPCVGAGQAPCRDHATLKREVHLREWDAVSLEVSHSAYRFDVAITHHGRVVYGFEIFFKHQVPQEKADALTVPWLELLAEDILEYRPRIPIHWPPFLKAASASRCPVCEVLSCQLELRAKSNKQRSAVQAEFVAESRRVERAWRSVLEQARVRRFPSKG